jgi:hypothetical protein
MYAPAATVAGSAMRDGSTRELGVQLGWAGNVLMAERMEVDVEQAPPSQLPLINAWNVVS